MGTGWNGMRGCHAGERGSLAICSRGSFIFRARAAAGLVCCFILVDVGIIFIPFGNVLMCFVTSWRLMTAGGNSIPIKIVCTNCSNPMSFSILVLTILLFYHFKQLAFLCCEAVT
jgi:hypothetical protein